MHRRHTFCRVSHHLRLSSIRCQRSMQAHPYPDKTPTRPNAGFCVQHHPWHDAVCLDLRYFLWRLILRPWVAGPTWTMTGVCDSPGSLLRYIQDDVFWRVRLRPGTTSLGLWTFLGCSSCRALVSIPSPSGVLWDSKPVSRDRRSRFRRWTASSLLRRLRH